MKPLKRKQFNHYIEHFEFDQLFNQLGWNYKSDSFPKKAADNTFQFQHIAEKEGFAILVCQPDTEGKIPDAQTRKRIHTEIAKLHHEHLIIFVDKGQTTQQWELLVREPNKPVRTVSHKWIKGQAPELLYQKLSGAFFSMEEDEAGTLTIIDVVQRIRENFGSNAEKVTKKFYAEFKRQHTLFLDFIKGIDDHIKKDTENTNKQWYASLMLNRLMFCYFIQKKGFLDQDKKYLKNKLLACRDMAGKGKFYSFYRSFLLELFHDGLGKPMDIRSNDLPVPLGKIPYLNGGLFDVHELERQFEQIQVADEAFERIFDFFDEWEWHLDTREHAEGKTINPDVIGYIFEKYINDRAKMGAYYTKEDITDYIGKNTIIPFLFDETERHHREAFKPGSELWTFLKNSGDTYIYAAVKHGVPKTKELFSDLPEDVINGFVPKLEQQVVKTDTRSHLWELRKPWNQRAPDSIALPTELYRELIDRRRRYAEVKAKIESGGITHINDLITYNLNVRQFAQDYIETTHDPVFIRHFYKALSSITILDPTCGSGAFLFAALNILEPLYETCLHRMEEFAEEEPGKHTFFKETLQQVNEDKHPSLQYFIYKTIILHNLFGVDIMREAVEIAKLRLFLRLVATVDVDPAKKNYGLEPLPDIDFNIRAGNTLVGFATEKELIRAVQADRHGQYRTGYEKILAKFTEECELVSKAYTHFQNSQLVNDQGSDGFKKAKADLNNQLKVLNERLNEYLADTYGVSKYEDLGGNSGLFSNPNTIQQETGEYKTWQASHQPFHWFAEFYQIIGGKGGFDVIIGNPPYVEMKDLKSYSLQNYDTLNCGNLYALCFERCFTMYSDYGKVGLIIPVASVCTDRYQSLQDLLKKQGKLFVSNYNDRPSKLFDGLEHIRLSIVLTHRDSKKANYSSRYYKWNSVFREYLFNTLAYAECTDIDDKKGFVPKVGDHFALGIYSHTLKQKSLKDYLAKQGQQFYYTRKLSGFVQILDFVPKIIDEKNQVREPSELKSIEVQSGAIKSAFLSVLNSSYFYWLLTVWSDCRNLNNREVFNAPLTFEDLQGQHLDTLTKQVDSLFRDFENNSELLEMNFKNVGKLRIQCIYPKKSKPILDQIDTVLAEHYGFTEEELDFIINYDIKYRMGKVLFGEEGEDEGEEGEEG